jgi:glycosyltransferase involved in cell wall biosynthesis
VTTSGRSRITPVILTFNEERNLPACLESLAHLADRVFVVDSGSTDRTVSIATECGAEVFTHPFESHVRQWQWALASLPIETPWVLAIDADQSLTAELRASIASAVSQSQSGTSIGPAGFYLNRRQIFRGRWIRHGGYYPKYLLKLFRRDAVRLDENDLVDHHFSVDGATATLAGDLIEDNHNENEIAVWIAKHNRYAVLQARDEEARIVQAGLDAAFGSPDDRTRWQKGVWQRLPLYLRPFGYFFYRYVLRLGFLDGKQGFIFHFMQAFWYRLLVDINRDEQRSAAARLRGPIETPDVQERADQSMDAAPSSADK